jgi:hypothetical protein
MCVGFLLLVFCLFIFVGDDGVVKKNFHFVFSRIVIHFFFLGSFLTIFFVFVFF